MSDEIEDTGVEIPAGPSSGATGQYGPLFPGWPVEVKKHRLLDCYKMYLTEKELKEKLNGDKYFEGIDLNAVIYEKGDTEELEEYNAGEGKPLVDLEEEIRALRKAHASSSEIAAKVARLRDLEEYEDTATVYLKDHYNIGIDKTIVSVEVETESSSDSGGTETETIYVLVDVVAPFTEAQVLHLAGVTFKDCYFGKNQTDTILADAGMDNSVNLKHMDFSQTTFINCTIGGADIFTNSDLYGASFQNCTFNGVNFDLTSNPRESDITHSDPLNHSHEHAPRPVYDWNEIIEETIDSIDHTYWQYMSYWNASGATFDGCTMSGKEFAGWNLTNARFYNCSMDGTHLHNATISNTLFSDMSLNNFRFVPFNVNPGTLILSNVSLANSIIIGVVLDTIDFASFGFSKNWLAKSTLTNCNFKGLNLEDSHFQNNTFTNCDFSGATLTGCIFDGSTLTSCDFSNFVSTNMYFPRFINCVLDSLGLSSGKGARHCNFFGSTIKNCTFDRWDFLYGNLGSVKLNSDVFKSCLLNGVISDFASYSGVEFTDCEIRGVKLMNSTLANVSFTNCDLSGTDMTGTTIANTTYENSDLTGVTY